MKLGPATDRWLIDDSTGKLYTPAHNPALPLDAMLAARAATLGYRVELVDAEPATPEPTHTAPQRRDAPQLRLAQ